MDEKTITLTSEERDYLHDLVYYHIREIKDGETTYGSKDDNEYMKNLYQNILDKL